MNNRVGLRPNRNLIFDLGVQRIADALGTLLMSSIFLKGPFVVR